jgi:two-component system cell cycle response regulator DivK
MKKILIVEDVEFNLDLLVQLLEDDYSLLTARDGASGLALAQRENPDLILMDMSLPVMDGWEATSRIKGDQAKALQAGCDDYLTKPLDDELLFAKLAELLKE